MNIDTQSLLESPLLKDFWYYKIEVVKDVFTPGFGFSNVALTRKLLQRLDVTGAHCLDIGTMEGLVPALLSKRNAKRVVALDTVNFQEKVELVKALHNVRFEYHANVQVDDTVAFIKRKWLNERESLSGLYGTLPRQFDLVVLSGILYHVWSPFHLLGYARTLVRPGGIVIVETAALLNESYTLQYNFNGSKYIYQWYDTWFISVPLLDYLLRFCRLAPIDCIYLDHGDNPLRIAVACRAVDKVVPDVRETLMADCARNFDYSIIVEDDPPEPRLPDIPYSPGSEGLVMREATGTCDLMAACRTMQPYMPGGDESVLRLDAKF
jgi:SAM-dependent methyltransferase